LAAGSWVFLFAVVARVPATPKVAAATEGVACVPTLMLQPARRPLQKNKMLLLFPEQNETATTVNQCVVFRIDFGPHAYSI
jgi:hypothetical protein